MKQENKLQKSILNPLHQGNEVIGNVQKIEVQPKIKNNKSHSTGTHNPLHQGHDNHIVHHHIHETKITNVREVSAGVLPNYIAYVITIVEFILCCVSFDYATNTSNNFEISKNFYSSGYLALDGTIRLLLCIGGCYMTYCVCRKKQEISKICVSWIIIISWVIWETITFFLSSYAISVCSTCVSYLWFLLFESIAFYILLGIYAYKKRICCCAFRSNITKVTTHEEFSNEDYDNTV